MQSYAPPRRKSSAGKIVALVLILGFLFLSLLVAAGLGVIVLTRSQAEHARVMETRQRAMAQLERARAAELAARRAAETAEALAQAHGSMMGALPDADAPAPERRSEPIRVANREITLQLDAAGNIQMDGKPVESKQLKTLLRNASKGRESALTVLIKADRKCLFEHVATVLEACQDVDVPNVRITRLD